MQDQKPGIIYVGDPMCSWCYGISKELEKLNQSYEMIIIVGGLRGEGDQEWNQEFKNFLESHWKEIEAKTGMPFGYDLMTREHFNYNTEPACRAVVTFKKIDPSKTWSAFKGIQHKFYKDNEDPTKAEFYISICENNNVDYDEFIDIWKSADIQVATQNNFKYAKAISAESFPSIYVLHGEDIIKIGAGYTTFEVMQDRINSIYK